MLRKTTWLLPATAAALVVAAATAQAGPAGADGPRHPSRTSVHLTRGAREGRHPAPVPDDPSPSVAVKYYGGRVISNVEVVQVLWGTGQQTDVSTQMGGFYTAATGAYLDFLGEYDTVGITGVGPTMHAGSGQQINRGTFKSTVQITPTNTATSLTDSAIATELTAQIAAGHLPAPTKDSVGDYNTLYMIDFPSSVFVHDTTVGYSCNDPSPTDPNNVFCAYHGATVYQSGNLAYGVLPDLTGNGCNSGCGDDPTAFNNVTSTHSHELMESITDPDVVIFNQNPTATDFPISWYSDATDQTGGEVADICDPSTTPDGGTAYTPNATLAGTSYVVQKIWSQKMGACVVEPTLPACNGSNRPCTPAAATTCSSDTDCAADGGSTPHCDTTPGSPKLGQCVGCATNANCSGGAPICDSTTYSCRACNQNADCNGEGVCATSTTDPRVGTCVQCTQNTDCTTSGQICDTTSDTCGIPLPDGGILDDDASTGTTADSGGNGDTGSTTTTTTCSASPGRTGGAGAFAGALGVLLALAATRRRK